MDFEVRRGEWSIISIPQSGERMESMKNRINEPDIYLLQLSKEKERIKRRKDRASFSRCFDHPFSRFFSSFVKKREREREREGWDMGVRGAAVAFTLSRISTRALLANFFYPLHESGSHVGMWQLMLVKDGGRLL